MDPWTVIGWLLVVGFVLVLVAMAVCIMFFISALAFGAVEAKKRAKEITSKGKITIQNGFEEKVVTHGPDAQR